MAEKKIRRARKAKVARRKPAERPKRPQDGLHVYSVKGEVKATIEVPPVFRSDVRPDLVRRAVTAARANRRQPYGPSRTAGMRHSAHWSGKGHGVSRVPRIRGTMIGAQAPGTVGGRKAHAPKPSALWAKKINAKERRLARNAALAAIRDPEIVARRGHRFRDDLTLPVVVEDAVEGLEKTTDAIEFLTAIGLYDDVLRARRGTHVRAGRGKMRSRLRRQPRSFLFVVADVDAARRGFGNLPGVDLTEPDRLNAEALAPGGDLGRLTMFTESAIERVRRW